MNGCIVEIQLEKHMLHMRIRKSRDVNTIAEIQKRSSYIVYF